MREALLFIHPTLGVLGILGAVWVFVEALSVEEGRLRRMRIMSIVVAVLFLLTWISGGLWDSFYYGADRMMAAKGSWVAVGDIAMEFKEHLFVLILLLSLYLPVLTYRLDLQNTVARTPILTVAALIVLFGLAMEGAGATLAGAVHVGMETMMPS
ncbi:MAG: hypothetical protein EOQ28_09905 [Mesorhizobium sp.]|uniref:hypothetical protein n=1 Tax=Mesorhizobium sp. TaxID=1871066 RepID=UPI000FEA071E|nr:hypothetical protein [Mesorhizobium sp.]RWA75398.1 MAG: hypothetical protein EOQ28_09905 [Mesorhizobium sp.]